MTTTSHELVACFREIAVQRPEKPAPTMTTCADEGIDAESNEWRASAQSDEGQSLVKLLAFTIEKLDHGQFVATK